jgi:DNA-binding transcriptional LysR family regulator
MNIEDLNAFLSVAKHSSFSLAAEELHLTQPAVSKRIAALESTLNAQLFDRIGRQISLTEAGRALERYARRILSEVEDSRRTISNLSGAVSGPLKLAASHHISLHRLPSILRSYIQQYPEVQLGLVFMDSELACRAVEQGELELALVTLPQLENTPLTVIEVWTDRLVLAASHDHPLRNEKKITPAVLARYPAILPARGTYTRTLIDKKLAVSQLEAKLETHYLENIKMMVSVGLGWSLLPENMLEEELRLAEGSQIVVERRLGIVHHPRRTLSNAARAFIELALS